MQFRVLGPLEVDAGDGPVPLGGPKQRAVLANLLIRANQVVPTETLIDEVWGDDPPEQARNTLQTYVSNLRKQLGEDRLQGRPPGYVLLLDRLELDATGFDHLVREAKQALPVDPGVAIATLDDALALWRGPALADLADRPSLLAEAARLDELRLEAQEERIEGLLASGDQTRAIGALEALLVHHSLRERLWSLLMLAMYRDGRQADALNAFQRAREILADELGIDPSPELSRLHERILRQDRGLDLSGEPLRGYRLLEKLGEGSGATVFRAIQPHVGRDVVVKVFAERVAADGAFVRRFDMDAQTAAALEHPHIAPIHDYWREPGRAYVVSRYLRDGSLRALLERGDVQEPERALRVVEQIGSALAFAHRQQIAHGNVTASNVLFDAEGNAYLGDFCVRPGADRDPEHDVRSLARLTAELLKAAPSPALEDLVRRAADGPDVLSASAFVEAARATMEPAVPPPRLADLRNPYKGLRPFGETDRADFFGRGALVRRLLARTHETTPGSRFLAVVGPSGSGKSSVVRGGLVPALRDEAVPPLDRSVAEMIPGAHPIEELESALLRVAVRPAARLRDILESGSRGLVDAAELVLPGAELVLVVDQFEEVFTLTGAGGERELFLESLRVASVDPDARIRIIVTLRADFFDRPLVFPRFGDLLADRTEAVPPMTPDELEEAIRGPAALVGTTAEPGLVGAMIADVAHQPGALPLLQYALTELFERRGDDGLDLQTYRELGGIAGAVSARAEDLFRRADRGWQGAVRQVLLRLVTLGEGAPDTRRRIPRGALDALEVEPATVDDVLLTFGRHRLLTFDREPSTREPTVEIAHEALLTSWQRFRVWIDEARDDLRRERRLVRAAAEWQGSGRDPSFLMRGAQLEQTEAWVRSSSLVIGAGGRGLLKASVDRRQVERLEDEARRERADRAERRSARRLRALVAVFAIAALVAGTLTVVATDQRGRAASSARVAGARELAAAAVANVEVDPELSVLLAVEAIERTRVADGSVLPEATTALHRAIAAARIVRTIPGLGGTPSWGRDEMLVSTAGPEGTGVVDIRAATTGHSVRTISAHDGEVTVAAFNPDGSMLVTAGVDATVRAWDPATGRPIWTRRDAGAAQGLSFSADGTRLAVAWRRRGVVRVLRSDSGRPIATLSVLGAIDTALSPSGNWIAVATRTEAVVLDVDSGRPAALPPIRPEHGVDHVAWSPDGELLASIGFSASADIWDASTGELQSTGPSHSLPVAGVAWSPDSSHLATGSLDGTAKVWDVGAPGDDTITLSAASSRSGIAGIDFSRSGLHVATTAVDGSGGTIWDVGIAGGAEVAALPALDTYTDVEMLPDGRHVVAIAPDGAIVVWDLATQTFRRVGAGVGEGTFDVSDDGRWLAVDSGESAPWAVRAWDLSTGRRVLRVENQGPVDEVSWGPDATVLAMAEISGQVRIVDRSGREVRTLVDPSGAGGWIVRFSPDGRTVATGTGVDDVGARTVTLWEWPSGEVIRTITADANQRLEFDPTGARFATTGSDTVTIWSTADADPEVTIPTNGGAVIDLDFSPDGSRIATAGTDATVRVFDARSGALETVLPGRGTWATGVDFGPDGSVLVARGPGAAVRVWALDVDDLIDIAHGVVTRTLTDAECRMYLHMDGCPG